MARCGYCGSIINADREETAVSLEGCSIVVLCCKECQDVAKKVDYKLVPFMKKRGITNKDLAKLSRDIVKKIEEDWASVPNKSFEEGSKK